MKWKKMPKMRVSEGGWHQAGSDLPVVDFAKNPLR
jgi:hypothetical protein